MEVRVDLAQIVIAENREMQLIVLRERNGERTLPILIGIYEAHAIERRMHLQSDPGHGQGAVEPGGV